jgi:DNA-binding NtrC family response regulator
MRAAVLIVDDEPGMRELLKRWLAGENYDALEAGNAEEALEVLTQTPHVKVVIVDVQMPGKGGAWLIDQIQQRCPSTAVVLATANDQVPGTLSLQPSVVGYLVKPLSQEGVRRHVRKGVQRSHEFAERARVRSATDPIDTFLDRKLTSGNDDDRD